MKKRKILVMCTGNSFRSHIAEAYLRKFAGDKIQVYSAGVKAADMVYPWTIKLMAEEGIDISDHASEQVDKYLDIEFDYLITVCDNAKETCPLFPRPGGKKLHQSFKDYEPKGDFSEYEYMETLRPIRDAIKKYCKEFVKKEIE